MSIKTKILSLALGMLSQIEFAREERKRQILEKWELSKQMPRKMKKQVRKELNLDWKLANIDLLNFNF